MEFSQRHAPGAPRQPLAPPFSCIGLPSLRKGRGLVTEPASTVCTPVQLTGWQERRQTNSGKVHLLHSKRWVPISYTHTHPTLTHTSVLETWLGTGTSGYCWSDPPSWHLTCPRALSNHIYFQAPSAEGSIFALAVRLIKKGTV